ncbi:MAG TPA: hypothetical protein VN766_15395 [Stellaceae bacterium]|nr:hypothetical protein [Stellaceae bacterium]
MDFPPGEAYAKGLKAVGYHDLLGKPGFKLALHKKDERWYLYSPGLWESGFHILDVTDPTKPRHLRWVAGHPNTWTLQVQIAGQRMITSAERIAPGWGDTPGAPFDEGFHIWDLADPESPEHLGQWKTGGSGTHRNYYDGGRYVFATGLPEGYEGHILQIIDIDDPTHPVEVSRWWRKGQWKAGGETGAPQSTLLHGGAYRRGERAYLPYGGGGFVILDVSDVKKPRLVGDLPFSPPFQSFIAVHTAQPLSKRELVICNSEAIAENCNEPLGYAGIVDIKDETKPRLCSLFPLPRPPEGAPYKNFCEKGGRFGPHNQHQWQYQDILFHDENLCFLTYFNAGLRVFDISDDRLVKEIAYFVPPDPVERRGVLPKTKLVCQSEDVLVDARGFIYVTDKNHGIYVLRLDRA